MCCVEPCPLKPGEQENRHTAFKGSVVVPVHPCRAPLGGADKAGHVTAAEERSSIFRSQDLFNVCLDL